MTYKIITKLLIEAEPDRESKKDTINCLLLLSQHLFTEPEVNGGNQP